MMRAFIEEACALVSLGLFLSMIWLWANIIEHWMKGAL